MGFALYFFYCLNAAATKIDNTHLVVIVFRDEAREKGRQPAAGIRIPYQSNQHPPPSSERDPLGRYRNRKLRVVRRERPAD